MCERRRWLRIRARIGWLLLAGGLALLGGSVIAGHANPGSGFDVRVVGGLGIAVGGIGLAFVVRYGMALRDEAAAHQVIVEERDERQVLIRQRAASRAYWTSATLVYAGLMWSSFAANGQLPALEGDGLWNFLAAAVLLPFAVYLGSIVVEERAA